MKKMIALMAVLAVLAMGAMPYAAMAEGHKKGMMGKGDKAGLEGKVCMKAGFMLKNEEELGLSADQVKKIKDIKMSVKRGLIQKNAEIDLVALEIKGLLYEEKVDVKAVNALVDKKYDLKKAKAKDLVQAYANLKAVLSADQMKEMKSLWKKGCSKK